ncbi:hypothetical protein T08_11867, partial [Trichinella sp. T8]
LDMVTNKKANSTLVVSMEKYNSIMTLSHSSRFFSKTGKRAKPGTDCMEPTNISYIRTLQCSPVREFAPREIAQKTEIRPTACLQREMDRTEKPEYFFYVTGILSSRQAASARLFMNDAVRRELSLPGSVRDDKQGRS